jgi:hypothetical protein
VDSAKTGPPPGKAGGTGPAATDARQGGK